MASYWVPGLLTIGGAVALGYLWGASNERKRQERRRDRRRQLREGR